MLGAWFFVQSKSGKKMLGRKMTSKHGSCRSHIFVSHVFVNARADDSSIAISFVNSVPSVVNNAISFLTTNDTNHTNESRNRRVGSWQLVLGV